MHAGPRALLGPAAELLYCCAAPACPGPQESARAYLVLQEFAWRVVACNEAAQGGHSGLVEGDP